MTTIHAPDVNDAFTRRMVRRMAQELITEGFYAESDVEDVMQDLLLHLVERLPKFDPEKGRWSTFVRMVVQRYATTLRRRQSAECRGRRITHNSLSITIQGADGEPIEMANTVVEDDYRRAYGHDFVGDQARAALEGDVSAVLDSLAPDDRDLCRRLMSDPPAQVARDLQITRSALATRIERLRQAFDAAGLDGKR
jgi:RNA polymerase sigma-70 factor (ECF subfamily)